MKKVICVIALLLALVFSFSFSIQAAQSFHRKGDTDSDGEVTIIDATLIQRLLADLIEDTNGRINKYGNVDGDGLTIMDATAIQRFLAQIDNAYQIGEPMDEVQEPTQPPTQEPTKPSESISGDKVTIGGATFDVSEIPNELTISDSSTASADLLLYHSGEVVPEDFYIEVNDGVYDNKTDYADEKFKENYLKTARNRLALGYDCLVRDQNGNEAAWVYTHYESGLAYPYRASVLGFKCEKCTFPLDFYYKGVLIKRCMVTIDLSENREDIEGTIDFVHRLEAELWTDSMTDAEKLQALAKHIKSNYQYAQVNCVDGAVFMAFAARDLGLSSMLLYPGGEATQPCPRHYITYNIYAAQASPGGHCACLIVHKDGTVMRYDVQGGTQKVRLYDDKDYRQE